MSNHPNYHAQCASGSLLDLAAPKQDQFTWSDVAEHLAKKNRFNGATPGIAYSVAQHSVLVAENCPPNARIFGLLHDGHEAFLGDWISPVKTVVRLESLAAFGVLDTIEQRMATVIHAKAGLNFPLEGNVARAVRIADERALSTERRDLMAPGAKANEFYWEALKKPFKKVIKPMPWAAAAALWEEKLREYMDDPALNGRVA